MSSNAEDPSFLVASRVRSYIGEQGLKLSEDALEAMNHHVLKMIQSALERTRANKRLTVRPQDL